MNVRPLRDRVLVKRVEEQEQRIGGIIVPDTAKEKPQQAKVVAVGHGRVNDDGKTIPLDVQRGRRRPRTRSGVGGLQPWPANRSCTTKGRVMRSCAASTSLPMP
ncbi:MAG: hypothetical protein DMF96_30495 [Acidobacteria bacterium]|nr:MAG: hypothetical protein DMF96_30495 [Acidobacteriota bacterium]